ncbi:hypothetical protein [Paraburkholderia sp. J41]|nr:hypothetical protein [Paraburkholderia sp. J41]
MLVPDFAALRYFFNYRFPDVIAVLIAMTRLRESVCVKKASWRQALAAQ